MERAYLQYRVVSVVKLTREEIEQIKLVAYHHYDSACNDFVNVLSKWEWDFRDGKDTAEIFIHFAEFDIVAKILEQEAHHNVHLSDKWMTMFRELRDEQVRVNAHQMMNDESWSLSFRDELKRKFGDGTVVIPKPTTPNL